MINNKLIINFRNKLKNGSASIGAWLQIPSTDIAEILSTKNFSWIAIDMEHGNFNRESLTEIIRVISLSNVIPLVRVSNTAPNDIKIALDSGAYGVILPMINNLKELKDIISFCKWPPKGKRGVAFFRGNQWGQKYNDYKNFATKPIIIPMVETKEFAKDLKNINNTDDLDAVFIGPYDLSASLDDFGNFESLNYKKIIKEIISNCKKKSLPCGIHQIEPNNNELKRKIKIGFQFIAYSMDTVILNNYYKF